MNRSREHKQDSQGICPNCQSNDIHWTTENIGKQHGICKNCRCEITENYHSEYIDTEFKVDSDGNDSIIEWSEGKCPKCNSEKIDFQGGTEDYDTCSNDFKCQECGCEFTEVYVDKYCYSEIQN